jgi:phosphoenolpyruvate carboxykinase (ATP)
MITAALSGKLDSVKYRHDDIFNLDIPTAIDDVPSEVLDPKNTWIDKEAYDASAKKLSQMFVENFKKFENVSSEIINAGPKPSQ